MNKYAKLGYMLGLQKRSRSWSMKPPGIVDGIKDFTKNHLLDFIKEDLRSLLPQPLRGKKPINLWEADFKAGRPGVIIDPIRRAFGIKTPDSLDHRTMSKDMADIIGKQLYHHPNRGHNIKNVLKHFPLTINSESANYLENLASKDTVKEITGTKQTYLGKEIPGVYFPDSATYWGYRPRIYVGKDFPENTDIPPESLELAKKMTHNLIRIHEKGHSTTLDKFHSDEGEVPTVLLETAAYIGSRIAGGDSPQKVFEDVDKAFQLFPGAAERLYKHVPTDYWAKDYSKRIQDLLNRPESKNWASQLMKIKRKKEEEQKKEELKRRIELEKMSIESSKRAKKQNEAYRWERNRYRRILFDQQLKERGLYDPKKISQEIDRLRNSSRFREGGIDVSGINTLSRLMPTR